MISKSNKIDNMSNREILNLLSELYGQKKYQEAKNLLDIAKQQIINDLEHLNLIEENIDYRINSNVE